MESTLNTTPVFWLIIPAAGVGRRMGLECPKQYLELNGKTLLEHAVAPFIGLASIQRIFIAVSPEDTRIEALELEQNHPKLSVIRTGGPERAETVFNSLIHLENDRRSSKVEPWVLVQDAARPCVLQEDIERLLEQRSESGSLLAVPAIDTIKMTEPNGQRVSSTLDRQRIWLAQTPQMAPFDTLKQALQQALSLGITVTDEASALEAQGLQPLLVEGHSSNIKVTQASDLDLAAYYLSRQRRVCRK